MSKKPTPGWSTASCGLGERHRSYAGQKVDRRRKSVGARIARRNAARSTDTVFAVVAARRRGGGLFRRLALACIVALSASRSERFR